MLVSGDAAERTEGRFRRLCRERRVPLAALAQGAGVVDRAGLGRLIGRAPTAVAAVLDGNLARTVIDALVASGYRVEFLSGPERPHRP